ncbi:MAG: hypothetical protein WD871_01730 [Xanthobacteraceae bacterium]
MFCAVAAVLAAAAFAFPARAGLVACAPAELDVIMLEAEAAALGGAVVTLTDAGEIARYAAVVNEEPPPVGPADQLVIFVHPVLKAAKVVAVFQGVACMRFLIGPELHQKAWAAARGGGT